jgi:hypothetical protein
MVINHGYVFKMCPPTATAVRPEELKRTENTILYLSMKAAFSILLSFVIQLLILENNSLFSL